MSKHEAAAELARTMVLPAVSTTEHLSIVTGLPERTIRRLAAKGALPGVKLAGRWLFERGALIAALRPSPAPDDRDWPPEGLDEAGAPYYGGER